MAKAGSSAQRERGWSARLERWAALALPPLLFGLRLWCAVCLALTVAFALELQTPSWAGTSAAIDCQPVLGASLRKGWFRLLGTIIGAVAAVVFSGLLPQDRTGFLLVLALWCGACAFGATLLQNFASYAAALSGYTALIIAGDEMGQVGGLNGAAFDIAVARGTEICTGIVCAGLVLALTDLGSTRRRLTALLAGLTDEIAAGLLRALQRPAEEQAASRPVRRALLVRVSGLGAVIDQAAGEIATLPFNSRAVQAGVEGLTDSAIAWRSVANFIELRPDAQADAEVVRACLTGSGIVLTEDGAALPRAADAAALRRILSPAIAALIRLDAQTPSLRLLADRMASGLLGLLRGLRGMEVIESPGAALLSARVARVRVPDMLPPLLNGVRAFLAIGAAELLWVWTGWPNGPFFIVFTAVGVTLFAPLGDSALARARDYALGLLLTACLAAVVLFAILPQAHGPIEFCLALGLVLVPAGAMAAQPWHQPLFGAAASMFTPLLGPANLMSYDPGAYYNSALSLVGGVLFAMLTFALLPPMPPAQRARRLLALTLRDLRRLCRGRLVCSEAEWRSRVYGRLSVMPPSADPLQAARLAAALSLGREIIRLRQMARRFGVQGLIRQVTDALAAGNGADAIRCLHALQAALAAVPGDAAGRKVRLRARGLATSAVIVLEQFTAYFEAPGPR